MGTTSLNTLSRRTRCCGRRRRWAPRGRVITVASPPLTLSPSSSAPVVSIGSPSPPIAAAASSPFPPPLPLRLLSSARVPPRRIRTRAPTHVAFVAQELVEDGSLEAEALRERYIMCSPSLSSRSSHVLNKSRSCRRYPFFITKLAIFSRANVTGHKATPPRADSRRAVHSGPASRTCSNHPQARFRTHTRPPRRAMRQEALRARRLSRTSFARTSRADTSTASWKAAGCRR